MRTGNYGRVRMVKKESLERWTIEDAAELYAIRNWGSSTLPTTRFQPAVSVAVRSTYGLTRPLALV